MIAGVALRWVGVSLVIAGVVQSRALIGVQLRSPSCRAGGVARMPRRVAALYHRTPGAARLAARLRDAAIEMTPASFRLAQGIALVPLITLMVESTGSTTAGLGMASVAVRVAGAVLLRVRGGTRERQVEVFAEALARHLATELASGASPEEALISARAAPSGAHGPGADLLDRALARSRSGEPVTRALGHIAGQERAGRGRASLHRLTTVLELAAAGGAGTAALTRVADGIAAARHGRIEAASVMGEARLAAMAVPMLAAGMGLMLATTSPAFGSAALALPIAPVVLAAGAVAVAGTLLVRRITRS